MKDIKVCVTQEHISEGIQRSSEHCMVANALIDAGFKSVEVKAYTFVAEGTDPLDYGVYCFEGDVPEKIMDFDHGDLVEPFSFTVQQVDEEHLVKK